MEWKWTKGEPYERTKRHIKTNNNNIIDSSEKINKDFEISAYTSSLNYDENTWDILNQEAANNGFKLTNKREDLDVKIADRQLVQQRGFNPFLSENDYVEDVSIRDQFLKPQNTTQDLHNKTNDN